MLNKIKILFITAVILSCYFSKICAQQSKVTWSTFSMGYGAPKSATMLLKNVVGQSFVGKQTAANSVVTSGFIVGLSDPVPPTNITIVYPGDANNDGIVDARDILPLGQFYGKTGTPRQNPSYNWIPQQVQNWNPPEAAFADCNGNGKVQGDDVVGIIQNWHYMLVSPPPSQNINRVALCKDLLKDIDDQQNVTPAMKEIRAAIVNYMKTNLGMNFNFSLQQNFPNPFNPSTTIRFSVPEDLQHVKVAVYDVVGQKVWEKILNDVPAGEHEVVWSGSTVNGTSVSSGIYFYRIDAGSNSAVKRMMLIK